MIAPDPPRRLSRSIVSLFAGFVFVVAFSLVTDMALHAAHVFPPLGQRTADPLLLLAAAYRTAYAIVGSYFTARLAPHRPLQHAVAGGIVGLFLSTAGAVASWSHPELGPHWYPLVLVATAMPCAWVGGKLRIMQLTVSEETERKPS